eukprot:11453736-Alexandrium_andersonii.AAC.1
MQFVSVWWGAGRAAKAPGRDGFDWSEWSQAGTISGSANADAGAGAEDQRQQTGAHSESANADTGIEAVSE